MRTLYVKLPEDAVERLAELARREYREPKAQAGILILEGLRRAGRSGDRPAAARTDMPERAVGRRGEP
jgi:hypothetical protein